MLSCSCDFDDPLFWAEPDKDIAPLSTARSRRCYSCKGKISAGEDALRFSCWRNPRSNYEESRFGDEVYLADKYYCEWCAGVYLSLSETGLCVEVGDMRDALREYWEMTGFDPAKYQEVRNAKA